MACCQEQVPLKRIFHLVLTLENKWICMSRFTRWVDFKFAKLLLNCKLKYAWNGIKVTISMRIVRKLFQNATVTCKANWIFWLKNEKLIWLFSSLLGLEENDIS